MARGLVRPRAGYNLVAIYPELKQAREAVAHLERAGIEAGDISVVPKEAEDVEDTSLRDARVIGAISKRVLLVGTIAAIAGGFLGFFLGLAFFSGAGIWMAVAAGAVAGGLFGGFLGGMAGLSMSDDWELTFESLQKGGAAIVLGSNDREEVEKAAEALSDTSPLRVERFDTRGSRLVTQ
jgi:outer membrane lipoprotein SlyB